MTGEPAGSPQGCDRCWPGEPEAAWAGRSALRRTAELIDDTHVGVSILACPACGQLFASIFVEQVDWVDGDDPQYWTLIPITGAEASLLAQDEAGAIGARIEALDPSRRSLRRDCPKGAPPRVYWGAGASLD